jgi:hypothetical protein
MKGLISLQNIEEYPPEEEEEELDEEGFSREAWDLAIEDGKRMKGLESEREKIGGREQWRVHPYLLSPFFARGGSRGSCP